LTAPILKVFSSAVLTNNQFVLSEKESVSKARSGVIAFPVVPMIAVAGLPARRVIWLDGQQDRK